MNKGPKSRQHEIGPVFRIVETYDHDTLGAPFKVKLKNSVEVATDPKTGEEIVRIPDPMGLIRAVVRCRVRDPRKLSGDELRFLRRAIDVQANKLAAFLDCTPEHYSRCETGGRALSASAERLLRLFAYVATLCSHHPHKLLEQSDGTAPQFRDQKSQQEALGFINVFTAMTIQTFRNAGDVGEYVFSRCSSNEDAALDIDSDDADWTRLQPVLEAA